MELTLLKNTASEIMIPMYSSATPTSLQSGETVADAAYYKDGTGSWTSLSISDTVTEIGSTGMYTLELSASELNHDLIMIKFTSTNSADQVVIVRTGFKLWDETLADHLEDGSYGAELSTKADIAASTSTSYTPATTGSIVYGTDDAGGYTDTYTRDNSYWEIGEDVTNGITVQFDFNLPEGDRAGVIDVFGRYIGTPTTTHYLELWAYNFETSTYELLIEEFMPGGNTSDSEYKHEFFERHIDRTNSNLVRIQIRHNVTSYNAAHSVFVDAISASSVEVITANDENSYAI